MRRGASGDGLAGSAGTSRVGRPCRRKTTGGTHDVAHRLRGGQGELSLEDPSDQGVTPASRPARASAYRWPTSFQLTMFHQASM